MRGSRRGVEVSEVEKRDRRSEGGGRVGWSVGCLVSYRATKERGGRRHLDFLPRVTNRVTQKRERGKIINCANSEWHPCFLSPLFLLRCGREDFHSISPPPPSSLSV